MKNMQIAGTDYSECGKQIFLYHLEDWK